MWKSRYSDINSSSDEKIKIKKGLFGKKVVNMQNEPIRLPKKSKVEFKIQDNGVKLYTNNSEISSETFDKIWVDKSNPNIIYASVDGKGTMKIDCTTGKHTPLCEDIRYNKTDAKYCVDMQGNILELNDDCTTTPTGLKKVEEHSDSAHMVCKDENGKYLVLDITTLKPIVNLGFEDENVSCTLINQSVDNIPTLRLVSSKRDHYLVDKNNEVLHSIQCDSFSKIHNYNGPIETLRFYDSERNKTTILNYDRVSNKITEMYEVDNLVEDIIIKDDKTYLITSDKNNKMGVVDKENNIIVPHKYNNLKAIELPTNKMIGYMEREYETMFEVENDDKKGIISEQGKEIVPCEYKDIKLDLSAKKDDSYRFFAENENGFYGVVGENNKIEADFVYKIGIKEFYQVGSKKYNDKMDATSDKIYNSGLKLKNTKTGAYDYFSVYGNDCLIEAKDADIKDMSHSSRRTKTKTVEVPKYSEDDIFFQGVINGAVIDNIPLGIMLTDATMSEEKTTKTVEVEDDEMNY